MVAVWSDESISLFLRNLVLFRHLGPDEDSDAVPGTGSKSDLRFILVFGTHVLMGDRNTKSLREFTSYNEMRPIVNKYFPKLKEDQVRKALFFLEKADPIKPYSF